VEISLRILNTSFAADLCVLHPLFSFHQWLERGAISRAATGDDIFFLKPASGKFLSDCADHRADTPSRETVLDKVPPAPALIDDFLDLFASGT
jgi:hypothetical protein